MSATVVLSSNALCLSSVPYPWDSLFLWEHFSERIWLPFVQIPRNPPNLYIILCECFPLERCPQPSPRFLLTLPHGPLSVTPYSPGCLQRDLYPSALVGDRSRTYWLNLIVRKPPHLCKGPYYCWSCVSCASVSLNVFMLHVISWKHNTQTSARPREEGAHDRPDQSTSTGVWWANEDLEGSSQEFK